MKTPLFPALLALALGACSNEAAQAPALSTDTKSTGVADHDVRVRLGIVFTEGHPWMAGAILEQGTLRVGDRLFLHARDDQRAVIIKAMRDDATRAEVNEARAPQGVFLSFAPETPATIGDLGSDPILLGDPAAATNTPTAR